MKELLEIILSLSLSGALLILVFLLCKPLVKDKLSKRWQYYIWLIVVARLLLPFAPKTNLMGTLFQYFGNTMIQTDTSRQQEPPTLSKTDFSDQYTAPVQIDTGDSVQSEPEKVAAPSMFETLTQNIAAVCLLVWLLVSVCLIIRKITIYQSFVKYIKAGQIEISDMQLWERVGKLVEQSGIKQAVGLYANSLISSPLLIGFFRPCIMLPTTSLSESDFDNTILHELMHYRRRDMFYKWLVQITICLHWFNPLVYIMGREVNRACELSCDEAIIESMDAAEKQAYGDTLLNAMGMGGNYKDSLASITLSEGKELLKERLDAIMKFKKATRLTAAISIFITCLLCFAATVSGAYYVDNYSSKTIPAPQSEERIDIPYSAYSKYGIMYDEKADSLYYNHECIRYFEDDSTFYNGDGTISGSLFFHIDNAGEGNIDVYTVRNSQNELTGIRVATEDEFMQKEGDRTSILQDISDYKKYGVSADAVGNMYFKGSLVRELYDPVTETIIQKSRGAGFPKDSIDIEAVYDDGRLSGFRILSKEEYDIHTKERIEAVQDFWVKQQKQRK